MKNRVILYSLLLLLLQSFQLLSQSKQNRTTLIQHVWIVDGTGSPAKKGSIRISGNYIVAIGDLQPLADEIVIDGKNQYLSPGFIDSHSHHFGSLKKEPTGIAMTNQGITTIILGQDGESHPMDSLVAFFKQHQVAVNIASYTGHSSLREKAMGENNVFRKSTSEELTQMKKYLATDLQKGSLGLSTGLEYESAFYSSKEEVVALAQLTAKFKGRYMSHIRSEDIQLDDAINEIIDIGKITGMPVKLSHIKIANKDDWGKANLIIKKLELARKQGVDITADVYPYNFWNSTLRVLFPDKAFANLKSAELAVNKLFDANQSVLVRFAPNPSYAGKTVSAIAKTRNETEAVTLMNLIQIAADYKKANPNAGGIEALAGKSMNDADVAEFIKWNQANICSDGAAGGHPRGYGAFTRVLGKYVREQQLLTLTEAIHKMTGLTAQHIGLQKRGKIAIGYFADLVLFDPLTVNDNATIENGKALSTGINCVWVNGKIVYQEQQTTGELSGTLIKRN